ncbi:3'-5' exonuclease [Rhodosalinus sediminis]|uniref:3'-5' exonuclease n=1 Tax=Rhodosalinus sediminis TaxID=1940533 RepID=UPI002352E02F|nr:3'-5' exonuclease [Rhodosalinus sediminis]
MTPLRWSLRVRILLFFVALWAAASLAVAGALWLGWARGGGAGGFVLAGVASAFALMGLSAAVWRLFDAHVAVPVERLAAGLRAGAHGGAGPDRETAKFLGDLGDAAAEAADRLGAAELTAAKRVAETTAALSAERERLTALLSELPVATVLIGADRRIALYDGQAAALLARAGVPRLGAPITDYLEGAPIEAAYAAAATGEARFEAVLAGRAARAPARLRRLDGDGSALLILDETAALAPEDARPIVYDFTLLERAPEPVLERRALRDLACVVLDTETTGLDPERDALVQIAAVRVLGAKPVPGERFETLVNPGRRIPPTATRVHGIGDAHVAEAPDVAEAVARLGDFARDAVIVAHNAPFDLRFLTRAGGDWRHPVLDTVLLSAVLFGTGEAHSLDALCARLGVEIPEDRRHTAMGDTEATAEAFCRMLPMLEAKGLTTFGDVVAETRRHGRLLADLNAAPARA